MSRSIGSKRRLALLMWCHGVDITKYEERLLQRWWISSGRTFLAKHGKIAI